MRLRSAGLWALLAPLLAIPARAGEAAPPWPQAYRAVLQAQYAAKAPPQPSRPEESQKIYDTYLQSIGRPIRDQPGQDSATTPSH